MNIKRKIVTVSILAVCLFCGKSLAFPLIGDSNPSVIISQNEESVVYAALDMFSSDMELVSGKKPLTSNNPANNSILIGTIGKNPHIDKLIESGKISVDGMKDQWEAFQIQIVEDGVNKLLIVVGSDKRGTAYGILELSRLMGVSPWVWWADSNPEKKTKLDIPDDYLSVQKPSVQYRGIFINDEDLGFMPWSTQTIEKAPQKGATGPAAYEKVYQLMLRLRANTLWPAMHECTVPFHTVIGNMEMADKYAIVVGSSHCDPLLRIGGTEWKKEKYGDYNYITNKDSIIDFWKERLEEAGMYENVYTIGLRGIHDVGMEGAGTVDEKTEVIGRVIGDQRELLQKYVNEDLEDAFQIFVPYKEVLPIYENGLDVPEDVALMWTDDNYGYMTRFAKPEEQKRSGGGGVYYHISYLGRPHQYIWLSSTQPALVYWQMKKSWDTGARRIWILNVGDIKPAEYDMEFYFDMAWDIESINESKIYEYQQRWLEREFGAEFAGQLGKVRNEYYRLAHIRRPEFMGWSRIEEPGYSGGRTPVTDTEFNPYAFGDEIYQRLKEYETIEAEAMQIANELSGEKKDAYYQLVLFPVRGSAEMNKKLLYAQKARLYAKYDLPVANEYAKMSDAAFDTIVSLVDYYNNELVGGKWKGMMFRRAWGTPVYERAPLPDSVPAKDSDDVLVWAENYPEPSKGDETIKLTPFINPAGSETFVSVFSYNGRAPEWKVRKKPNWLDVTEDDLGLSGEKRLAFSLNSSKMKSKDRNGVCEIEINGRRFTFDVEVKNANKNIPVEYNGLVVLDVEKYEPGGSAVALEGLGYGGNALELGIGSESAVQYKFHTTSAGNADIRVHMLPNHPVNSEDIRYAISVDGGKPTPVSVNVDFKNRDEAWKINVLRNQSVTVTPHYFDKAGEHTITIYALDEGIILDQMAVDFQPDRKFYELPAAR